ncbi:hypothetical protein IJC60_05810 [bacterium]|nr:hypothetical protein [bacterium]
MNRIPNNKFARVNNLSFDGKSKGKEPMEDAIQSGINKLAQRAEREVAEYGDFAPVVEKLADYDKTLNIGEASIKIVYANYKDDKTLKRLELDVPSKSGKSNANFAMKLGNKKEILKILSSENLAERIKNNLREASSSFEDRSFA